MRDEDTAMAGGDKPQQVHMNIHCEMSDAPKDIKALWAIEQVIVSLNLTPDQIVYVLKFLRKRHAVPF